MEDKYNVAADVWSVTSYNELRREALHAERYNMLNPTETPKVPYITEVLKKEKDICVFASDEVKAMPDGLFKWIPLPCATLGTDGFGRSESREALRDFFEVDTRHIVFAALGTLFKEKKITSAVVKKAAKDLKINPGKLNPMIS